MASKRLRNGIGVGIGIALLVLFALALRPQPVLVDLGTVDSGVLAVTVNEEARTRVQNPYVVSAPVTGRLLRVEIDAGDAVTAGETVVARLLPTPPSVLDARTREQAQAAVSAAEAALAVAQADRKKTDADLDLANEQVRRIRALRAKNAISKAALDQAEREARAAAAATDVANAAIAMRVAELQSARAQLISFAQAESGVSSPTASDRVIEVVAPVSGQVLRVIQESETTLTAGAPILEVGDVASDLEIVAELLSSDAVRVSVGDGVSISDWGGEQYLEGRVARIEPWGFTKFSALGVEEQRVNTIIRFTGDQASRQGLGHGYRVEVSITVWAGDDILQIPTSALYRAGPDLAVFRVIDGQAQSTLVELGRNNGERVQITGGLTAGDTVVLYPSDELTDGSPLAERG
ncbi:MAG: HlyD family efflux transporter periplasmic adaptor subunit [Pseudomonadota bacterium]